MPDASNYNLWQYLGERVDYITDCLKGASLLGLSLIGIGVLAQLTKPTEPDLNTQQPRPAQILTLPIETIPDGTIVDSQSLENRIQDTIVAFPTIQADSKYILARVDTSNGMHRILINSEILPSPNQR